MHDMAAIEKGHGILCENGHRVGKDGIYITISDEELEGRKNFGKDLPFSSPRT